MRTLLCGGAPPLGFAPERKQHIANVASWATPIEQQLICPGRTWRSDGAGNCKDRAASSSRLDSSAERTTG
jgi:hypothetical protein